MSVSKTTSLNEGKTLRSEVSALLIIIIILGLGLTLTADRAGTKPFFDGT